FHWSVLLGCGSEPGFCAFCLTHAGKDGQTFLGTFNHIISSQRFLVYNGVYTNSLSIESELV
ncbi:MAG: hypothetical protein LBS65_03565, partial [Desulfovibrio sp.]|nr:hypothetical protein [Desulfovibrio sp.]